jgi:GNAT superfamily N-acetyltransferase
MRIRISGDGDSDVAALAALRRQWTREQSGEPDDPEFERRFAQWHAAEAGRRVSWLAEVDDQPVGMANLALFDRMPRPGRAASRWGYLANAFVLERYRNQGVGHQIVSAVLDYAAGNRLVRVVLSPSERAVPFYLRHGFGPADMLLARRLAPGT